MKQLFTNNAVSLLVEGIGPTDTMLRVMAGHGEQFPTPQDNEYFTVTLEDQSATMQEIIHVVHRDGDVFWIKRGEEGTTPRAWSASQGHDTLVDHRLTAATLMRLANTYDNLNFPELTDFTEALNYLLQGNPTSGGQAVDAGFTYKIKYDHTVLTTDTAFQLGTTAVYVGGSRLKRGVDFTEVSQREIRLEFIVTEEQMTEGQNIVVDYIVA